MEDHALDPPSMRHYSSGQEAEVLDEDPSEDVTMPLTKLVEKPVMSLEHSLSLIGAITYLHDLCLMLIGIFSGPRASEAMDPRISD